jgi:hypothetical protein
VFKSGRNSNIFIIYLITYALMFRRLLHFTSQHF